MTTIAVDDLRVIVARHFDGDDTIDLMTAICLAESGGVVEAVNDNYPTYQPDPNSPYRYDRGLAQINSIWGFDDTRLSSEPDYNLQCARIVWNAQGFGAWSTYNAGVYVSFLPIPHPADVYALIAQAADLEAGLMGRLSALAKQHAPRFVLLAERDAVKAAVDALATQIDALT